MNRLFILLSFFILFSLNVVSAQTSKTLLIEAESFFDYGGWDIDQQYMDQMGSPVLIAHGIGKPVNDATLDIQFPAAGAYRVFVRTRNWVAPWTTEHAPGQFQLHLDGKPLDTVFGTEGDAWHWQAGGSIDVSENKLGYALSLHDLTGFDGRVDAVCFTADPDFTPPNNKEALTALRRQSLGLPDVAPDAPEGPFDFVVVGGGYPGICAAISAARLGLKVVLIQDRPLVGGNASPEIGVGAEGIINLPPYENLGNLVYQLRYAKYTHFKVEGRNFAQKEMELLLAEKNITLYLATRMISTEMDGKKIKAVIGKNIYTGKETRFAGNLFADCTGDGNLGFLAGADYRVGRESKKETGESMAPDEADKLVMGSTLWWTTAVRKEKTAFPELPWAIPFTKETIQPTINANWDWETGMNMDQVEDVEKLRDLGLRAIYGHWAYMKNHAEGDWAEKVANRDLAKVGVMAGKRESRRLLGDIIVREQDIMEHRLYPDSCVVCTWPIDVHYATEYSKKYFPGQEFRTYCTHVRHEPFPLPYRTMYSRNVPNLFMAGRNTSVTHVALGVSRVIQTGGMMGEVIGMAASVCKKNNALPRDVYEKYLAELKSLMEKGIAPPPPPGEKPAEWTKTAGPNLARKAKVAVSSEHESEEYPGKFLNDGRAVTTSNGSRWVSRSEQNPWATLTFDKPVRVNGFQMISGQAHLKTVVNDFVLQYEKDGKWIDIPGSAVVGNENFYVDRRFNSVEAAAFRLWITKTPGYARVWELELYNAP
ncbi:pyridine nucleotide-disulfide oxidoreductase [Planctomycetales bacterium]|nr:pyridine nucleotide-disulfide oxidoreductase [Planctomycetales bacterium]